MISYCFLGLGYSQHKTKKKEALEVQRFLWLLVFPTGLWVLLGLSAMPGENSLLHADAVPPSPLPLWYLSPLDLALQSWAKPEEKEREAQRREEGPICAQR